MKKLRRHINAIKKQIRIYKIISREYGQLSTMRSWNSVDSKQREIPWYTYPAIEYLKNFDFKDKNIFEYGSGNSSIYWSKVSKSIISVEDDKEWFNEVLSKKGLNQKIVLKESQKQYVNYITEHNNFDVIIIDGKHRIECAKQAIMKIKDDGIIILDNSDRKEEIIASKIIRDNFDCIQIDFHGLGPINNYTWTTSIFFSKKSKLDSYRKKFIKPIGSL